MAITLDAPSAAIAISGADRAIPAVAVIAAGPTGDPLINAHLTNNFQVGNSGLGGVVAKDAWKAVGTVGVRMGAGDQPALAQWNFGFIQFQKINALTLYYNGVTRNGGGSVIQAHLAPALTATSGRDHGAEDPNPPWLRIGTGGNLRVDVAKGLATAETGDHPMVVVGTRRSNAKTASNNYLSQLVDDREFVTVFSARDPQGNFIHLAHFAWSALWNFAFTWRDEQPRPARQGTTQFKMGKVVAGPPSQKWVQGFLKDPAQGIKLGTSEQQAALRAAVAGPPTRLDGEDPVGSYPDDFFVR